MTQQKKQNRNAYNAGRGNFSKEIEVNVYEGRVMPKALELESAVLGAILLERSAITSAMEILKVPECFSDDANKKIFEVLLELEKSNKSIDLLTVVEGLKSKGQLEEVGGPFAITQLTKNVSSSANIETHSQIIYEKYLLRKTIEACGNGLSKAFDPAADAFDVLDDIESSFSTLSNNGFATDAVDSLTVSMSTIESIERKRTIKSSLIGVDTGIRIMNRITYGWQAPDLIILAARPSVGKTCLALNLTRNGAKSGVPIAFFSLEMSNEQLYTRLISTESEVELGKIIRGKLSEEEMNRVRMAANTLANLKIYLDDSAVLSILELRAKARRLVSKYGVGMIIIDYLQLMSGLKDRNGNREQEIGTISRNLKALAKELNIPIIALSQMSRDVEKRKGDPQLSDLRDSGAIEQDADIVMFAWRDDYQQTEAEKNFSTSNTVHIKFAKHRNGSIEKIDLESNLSIQKFSDPTETFQEVGNSFFPIPNYSQEEEQPF